MLNVQELERQWFRYKIKSYLPKILLLIVILILSILALVFSFNSDIPPNTSVTISKTTDSTTPTKKKKLSISKITTTPSIPVKLPQETIQMEKKPLNQEQLTIKPSFGFINAITYIPDEPILKPTPLKAKPILKKEPELKIIDHKNIEPIEETNIKIEEQEPLFIATNKLKKENSNFSINIKQEETDIQEVLKRFYNNKNPVLSLFVAKRFYAMKKYRDAYNYALITNEINAEIEESWLIAAKSLTKLNKKDKAIDLLNKFITESNSIQAVMLLEQIKSGTL
jgi:hypothetical protein